MICYCAVFVVLSTVWPPQQCDGKSRVLIGTEAKGQEAAAWKCYPQLLAFCGESAIDLYLEGLKLEVAVVPEIATVGSAFQFCALYLIPDVFPVMVALSPALDPLGSLCMQDEISKWRLRFMRFAEDTETLLRGQNSLRQVHGLNLSVNGQFFKPVTVKPLHRWCRIQ